MFTALGCKDSIDMSAMAATVAEETHRERQNEENTNPKIREV